jgi:DNA-binding PadR family transcriptional regulator
MAVSETEFWVLTALGSGRRHGYSVLQEVQHLTSGGVTLRVTTLYATLERLQRSALVQPAGEEVVEGRARRYFELTDVGRSALEDETRRLEARVRAARAVLASRRPSPATRVGLSW